MAMADRHSLLDPRGPRFAAWLTTAVLVAVLVTGYWWLALAQAVVFAVTAYRPRWGPYSLIYRAWVAPRLGPPSELEPAAPVRFAQLVGLGFAAVATAGYLSGAVVVGAVAAAFALIAAFLNAAFGLCLGCEAYLLIRRLTNRPLPATVAGGDLISTSETTATKTEGAHA
jgi:hypothetical protein